MVREQQGWTLPDLSARLKIRQTFLEAIEAGDLAALPAPAYAAGFIRSYADTMGLDPEEILRRFRAEGRTRAPQPELIYPKPVPDRRVRPVALVLIVAVVAIGGYALWYHHSEKQIRSANSAPAKPVPHASAAQPAAAGTPAKQAGARNGSKISVSAGADAAAPGGGSTGTASAAGSSGNASSGSATPSATTPGAAVSSGPALEVSATARSWVQVRGPHGKVLFSGILNPGQSWTVPNEPGLVMTTGNAGGTVLVRNGKAGSPLGAPGSVLHGVQLTGRGDTGAGGVAGRKSP